MIESGPPGTESNLPRQPAQPRVRRGGSSRTMETTNYQTSRTVTKTRIEPGTVKRLSVAVIVDQRLEWDEEAGRAVRRPRSAEQMEKIRGLVIAAAGIVAERGDLVTTESLPFTIFEPPPQAPAEPVIPPLDPFTLDWLRRYQHYFISTVAGLLLLAAAAAGLRYWLRGRTAARAESQKLFAEDEERRTLIEAENEEKRIRAEENRLLQGLKMATVQTGRAQILKRYIEESAGKDPIAFVQLLRAWIHEDD